MSNKIIDPTEYGFVYCWRDKQTNRYYIGSHWGKKDDGYICGSIKMREEYAKRPSDFKRRILKYVYSEEDLQAEEAKWVRLIPKCELGNRYYNETYSTGRGPGSLQHRPRQIQRSIAMDDEIWNVAMTIAESSKISLSKYLRRLVTADLEKRLFPYKSANRMVIDSYFEDRMRRGRIIQQTQMSHFGQDGVATDWIEAGEFWTNLEHHKRSRRKKHLNT